ncbi:MAG TPA: hypothetical protein VGT01_03465, partial [Candidatus Dormibacteraeota bacterium]|nr:hypothetical protein [Candidatus Dormibacteraeota bacterium]
GWNQYLTPAQNAVDSLDQFISTDTYYWQLGQSLMDSHAAGSTTERDQILSDTRTSLAIFSNGSHLVQLKVECRVAQACTTVLNTTIQLWTSWLVQTEQQQADVAIQFYTSQLQSSKDRLQTASDALNTYTAAHPRLTIADLKPDPQLDRLESDVSQAQTSVNDIQDKLQSIQFNRDAAAEIDQTAVRTIDPPTTSGGHFTSVTKKYAIALAVAAVVPGIAYLVFLGWIDRTTRNPKEIESRIGVPVVSTIGSLKDEAA